MSFPRHPSLYRKIQMHKTSRSEESTGTRLELAHEASRGLSLFILSGVELASIGGDIHVGGADPHLPVTSPNLPANKEGEDDGTSEVRLEEVGNVRLATNGEESNVELGDKADDVEEETNVTSDDTKLGLVRKLLKSAARVCPTLAETNVRKVDATPDKEVGETGKGQKPGEENATSSSQVNESQETEGHLEDDGRDRATLLVDVGEELGGHAANSQSLKSASRGKSGAVCDTDD